MKPTDVRVVATRLYFLPVETRVPLKFGTETLTSVSVARACVTVEDARGKRAEGWGETPLSVQWVWPSQSAYAERHGKLKEFSIRLAREWASFEGRGHAFEIGADFEEHALPKLLQQFNQDAAESMPLLAALVCLSLFDLAVHDAFGQLHQRPNLRDHRGAALYRVCRQRAGGGSGRCDRPCGCRRQVGLLSVDNQIGRAHV